MTERDGFRCGPVGECIRRFEKQGLQWMQRFVSFGWLTPLSKRGYRLCVMLGCLAAFSAPASRAPARSRRTKVEAALDGIVAVHAKMDAQGHEDRLLVVLGVRFEWLACVRCGEKCSFGVALVECSLADWGSVSCSGHAGMECVW